MQKIKNNHSLQVSICTNKKAPGKSCCADKEAQVILDNLKSWYKEIIVKNPDLKGKFRVHSSGCLDHCAKGVAIMLSPQHEMLIEVTPNDIPNLKSELLKTLNISNK